MKDLLEYKGFLGSVHFQAEDETFFGRLEEIDDLVSFEGRTVPELKRAFRAAVEDYVSICERRGKPLQKSFKGSFNVRIDPDLHRRAVRKALTMGVSLNRLVESALQDAVAGQ